MTFALFFSNNTGGGLNEYFQHHTLRHWDRSSNRHSRSVCSNQDERVIGLETRDRFLAGNGPRPTFTLHVRFDTLRRLIMSVRSAYCAGAL
jgi:hypothetical protein